MKRRKYLISDLVEHATLKSGKLLSKSFKTSNTKYLWQCSKGHKWLATWSSVKHKNTWCKTCYHKSIRSKNAGSYRGYSEHYAKEVIKTYSALKDFRVHESGLYSWLIRHDLLSLTRELSRQKMNKKKYTKQELIEIAQNYSDFKDFRTNETGVYSVAVKRGIIQEITSHMERQGSLFKRAVYIFEFEDKTAYIGITYDYNVRLREHTLYVKGRKPTAVYKKIKDGYKYEYYEQGKWLPKREAIRSEAWWMNYYIRIGWKLLNTAKAGSLGGRERVWNKEKVLSLAVSSKSMTRSMFKEEYPGACAYARKHRFYKKMISLVCQSKHTNWEVKKVIEIAKKYSTYSEFCKNEPKAKGAMYRLKVSEDVKKLCKTKKRSYTKSEILHIASLNKGLTRQEFIVKFRNVHYHAKKLGILNKVYKYMQDPKTTRSNSKKKK